MNKKYLCPVCGFHGLKEPPYGHGNEPSYEVCPCCGFEFGFDGGNTEEYFSKFRQRWIEEGTQWFILKSKPKNWDYKKQLRNLKK